MTAGSAGPPGVFRAGTLRSTHRRDPLESAGDGGAEPATTSGAAEGWLHCAGYQARNGVAVGPRPGSVNIPLAGQFEGPQERVGAWTVTLF